MVCPSIRCGRQLIEVYRAPLLGLSMRYRRKRMVYKNEQERKANDEKKKLYDPSNILLCLRRRVIPQWRDHPEGRRWGVGEVGGLRGGGERQPVTRFHNGGIGAATPVLVSGQAVGRRDGALVVYVDVRTSSSPFNPAIPPPLPCRSIYCAYTRPTPEAPAAFACAFTTTSYGYPSPLFRRSSSIASAEPSKPFFLSLASTST